MPAIEDVLAQRFQLDRAPSLSAQSLSKTPILFTRLRSAQPMRGRSLAIPPEEAFAFQVPLSPPFFSELWIAGRRKALPAATPGDVFLFDLSGNPTVGLDTPFDTLRCYISQTTLDDLARERGLRRVPGLCAPFFGDRDPVLYGLAQAAAAAMAQSGGADAIFTEYLALAFHAHIVQAYGGIAAEGPLRGGLAPWQLRRADAFMAANLKGDPSISQLAKACGLSPSHFARAFRQSMGMPPHQWLTKMRVEQAKALLRQGRLDLAEIALACGFADQSHFTRAFSRREGHSPGRWQRLHRI